MNNQLYCGAAKINITPSEELLPYMFGLMRQQYGCVHDELFLRVIALGSAEEKAMIVIYDLDKATNPVEWVKLLERETGVPAENILYLAIHTHTAPITGYRPFEGPNFIKNQPTDVQEKVGQYEEFLLEKLVAVAKEAVASMIPAKMGYATGECHIAINRCQKYNVKSENGEIMHSMNIGFDPQGITDPTLLVVRFDDLRTGAPIAFFTNYAVHCVAAFLNTCDDGKAFLSSDIGGTVSKLMEKAYPGSVALWSSAPAGDINPVQMVQNFYPDPETGEPLQHCIKGENAADTILTVMASRQFAAIQETMGRVACDIAEVDLKGAIAWAKTEKASNGFSGETPVFDQEYAIRTHLLQIGPLALIGVDGELYTSLGQAMKAASPVKDTFVLNHECSLLLNNPGYIMDDTMMKRLKECDGRGSQRGGIPGGGVYTRPGTVKAALEQATKELFA